MAGKLAQNHNHNFKGLLMHVGSVLSQTAWCNWKRDSLDHVILLNDILSNPCVPVWIGNVFIVKCRQKRCLNRPSAFISQMMCCTVQGSLNGVSNCPFCCLVPFLPYYVLPRLWLLIDAYNLHIQTQISCWQFKHFNDSYSCLFKNPAVSLILTVKSCLLPITSETKHFCLCFVLHNLFPFLYQSGHLPTSVQYDR